MLVSYDDFEKQMIEMLIIRSKNYVHTDCDLTALINTVYGDICSEIIFAYVKQSYTIVDEYAVVLKSNNISNDNVLTITEVYGEALDFVDANDMDIGMYLARVDLNTYKWTIEEYRDTHLGDVISVVRAVTYKLEHLPVKFYDRLFTSIIEGVMYHVQLSIPSQGDTQAGNLAYQRYYSEKKKLLNLFPQVQYVSKNMPLRNSEYEV